jgi:hypothetical protein
MKLLFKEDTFADEFKAFLGFVDADFTLLNLKSDISSATREIITFIGKELYENAVEVYETNIDEEDVEFELIQLIKTAIIVNAYRLYAPDNDLSHTNDGRKMRNEEHEKNAFEWMIDASDSSLEKRYYRVLEHLINYLDELEDSEEAKLLAIHAIWIETEAFKKLKKHFIQKVADFDEFFPINSKLLLIKLEPGLSLAEKNLILPRVGKTKYDQLLAEPTEDDASIIHAIKEVCAYYSLSWAIPRMSVNILPTGILQKYSSDRASSKASMVPALNESQWTAESFLNDAHRAAIDLENLLKPAPDPTDKNINPTITYNDQSFNCI